VAHTTTAKVNPYLPAPTRKRDTVSKFTADQLAEYTGKRVTVVRNLSEPNEAGESAVEVEGQVQVGNELGLLIKPKGKLQFDLINLDEIEEISLVKEGSKPLKRSKIAHVKIGGARRHLLERHGVTLKWANEATEEQAKEYHDSLNHEELDLGHVHVDKADKDEKKDDDAAGDES
jgi:hypothetical protein